MPKISNGIKNCSFMQNENVNEKFSSMKDCYMVNTLEVPEQYLNDERWLVELNNTEGYLDPTCLPY